MSLQRRNTMTQLGGGAINPKVLAHLAKTAKPKVQLGGGSVNPKLLAHVSKAAKK
jgi:hypothetical protein